MLKRDWKKLTFYYFADSYINFNSLVTDLFKVYKTRIWMSAMNPASFAHPSGLHPPGSGIAQSNPLVSIGESSNDPLHSQYGNQGQAYSAYPSNGPASMVGGNQRGSAQQAAMQQQQQQQQQQHISMAGFPPRHSPVAGFPPRHSPVAPDFIPQSGYSHGQGYMNGLSPQQNSYAMGDSHGHHNNDVWMALQGLSLGTH